MTLSEGGSLRWKKGNIIQLRVMRYKQSVLHGQEQQTTVSSPSRAASRYLESKVSLLLRGFLWRLSDKKPCRRRHPPWSWPPVLPTLDARLPLPYSSLTALQASYSTRFVSRAP